MLGFKLNIHVLRKTHCISHSLSLNKNKQVRKVKFNAKQLNNKRKNFINANTF